MIKSLQHQTIKNLTCTRRFTFTKQQHLCIYKKYNRNYSSNRSNHNSTCQTCQTTSLQIQEPNHLFINSNFAPKNFNPKSARVYTNIITSTEGSILQNDLLQHMKRKRRKFEKGHWDSVITNYKEIEIPFLLSSSSSSTSSSTTTTTTTPSADVVPSAHNMLSKESYWIIEKIRNHLEQTYFNHHATSNHTTTGVSSSSSSTQWLPPHAIFLKEDGILSAHVDSVKFSGQIVAGLSLLSTCIMRLKPASPTEIASSLLSGSTCENENSSDGFNNIIGQSKSLDGVGYVDLLLPPLSLYVLSDMSRFEYTHELLESGHTFIDDNGNQTLVERKDRLSVIFRDAKL